MRLAPFSAVLTTLLVMVAVTPRPALAGPNAETDFPSGGRIQMELCSSGAKILGTGNRGIRVFYEGNGEPDHVEVRLKASHGKGSLKVDGCPHQDFHLTVEVPRLTHLRVRMWAGQLVMEDVAGDKDLELHAGQMDIEVGKVEDYSRVDASVVTGEVDAAPFDVSKGGLFRSFEWTGTGTYRLHAHVGAGQITLR